MRTIATLVIAGLALPLCLLSTPAQAQLSLTLTPTPVSANPGDLLAFTGVLSNIGGDAIDLLGFNGTIIGPGGWLSFDDTSFFSNAPLSLLVGDSYTDYLYVNVSPSAAAGLYTATYEVEGAETLNPIQKWLASSSVNITIKSEIPEPGTLALLGFPAGVGALLVRRRQR